MHCTTSAPTAAPRAGPKKLRLALGTAALEPATVILPKADARNEVFGSPASDLLLVLWRRLRQSAVEVSGDSAAFARFLRRANLS